MPEPSQQLIFDTVMCIKNGIDLARAKGVDCEYPILVQIDGQFYSFATCVAECSEPQTELKHG